MKWSCMTALFSDNAALTVLDKDIVWRLWLLSHLELMSNLKASFFFLHRWRSKWIQHSWDPSLSRARWLPVSVRGGPGSGRPLPGSRTNAQAAVWLLHVFIPKHSHAAFKVKPSGALNTWGRGRSVLTTSALTTLHLCLISKMLCWLLHPNSMNWNGCFQHHRKKLLMIFHHRCNIIWLWS